MCNVRKRERTKELYTEHRLTHGMSLNSYYISFTYADYPVTITASINIVAILWSSQLHRTFDYHSHTPSQPTKFSCSQLCHSTCLRLARLSATCGMCNRCSAQETLSTYSGGYLEWVGQQKDKLMIALQRYLNHLEDDEELIQCQKTVYI